MSGKFWPGTRIEKSTGNAFTDWQKGDSIFTADKHFLPVASGQFGSQGRSRQAVATNTVMQFEKRTGRSRGTIHGLSATGDAQIGRTIRRGA